MRLQPYPDIKPAPNDRPARVTMRFNDGAEISAVVESARGGADKPFEFKGTNGFMITFDITSNVDLQEVDNALNQARKEVAQRYDFKGVGAEIDFSGEKILMKANSEERVNAVLDVFQSKLVKRGISLKSLDAGELRPDLVPRPEEAAEVLPPLEVGDSYTTGICQNVWNHEDLFLGKNRIGCRGRGSVGAFA